MSEDSKRGINWDELKGLSDDQIEEKAKKISYNNDSGVKNKTYYRLL